MKLFAQPLFLFLFVLFVSASILTLPGVFASGLDFKDLEIEVDGEITDDVDADGGSFEAAPGDAIVLDVEVENTFSTSTSGHEIRSIEVNIDVDSFCPDDLDEEIDEEIALDNLDPGTDDSATFRFTIPDCADEDNFDIDIRVEGKDDDDSTEYVIEETLIVTVDKEPSAVTLELSKPSPQTIDCDARTFSVDVEVHNIGAIDLDSGLLLIQEDLSINKFEFLDLRTGRWTEDDTQFEKTYTFTVSDVVAAGEYDLRAEIEYEDGDKEEKRFQTVIIPECENSEDAVVEESEEEVLEEDAADEKTTAGTDAVDADTVDETASSTSVSTTTSVSTATTSTSTVSSPETVEEKEEVSEAYNGFFTLPVLISALVLGLLILFAMLTVLLKKK